MARLAGKCVADPASIVRASAGAKQPGVREWTNPRQKDHTSAERVYLYNTIV